MRRTLNIDEQTQANIRESQEILKTKFGIKMSLRRVAAWSLKQSLATLRGEAFFATKKAFDEEQARGYARYRETLVATINDELAATLAARIVTVERDGVTCIVVVDKDALKSGVALEPEVAKSLRMNPAITDFDN